MDKLFHIFISSTYSDLEEERKKVSEAIAKAGYVAEGMEIFPASSQKQFDFIKRIIDRCDYYVVIVGGRYGSISDNGLSYTEAEYEYALSKNIPALAFLHRNPDNLEAKRTEKEPSGKQNLTLFRERLSRSAMVDFWDEPSGLATSVVVAIGQEVNLNPGIGWIRGDKAADPKLLDELAKAEFRIRLLEQEISLANEDAIQFTSSLASIDENFNIKISQEIKTYMDGKAN